MKINCNLTPHSKHDKHVYVFSHFMKASKDYSLPRKITGKLEEIPGPQNVLMI